MIHPTPRLVFLFAAGIPVTIALVLASETAWPLGFGWLAGCVLAFAMDVLGSPRLGDMRIRLNLPSVLYIGDTDPARLDIDLAERRGRQELSMPVDLAVDLGGPLEPLGNVTVTLGNEILSIDMPLTATRRGTALVHRVWTRWRGPFGLAAKRVLIELDREIPVIPNVRAVHGTAVKLFSRGASFGAKTQIERGEGSEFNSLREFAQGHDPRTIDWKHSARHRKLLSKELQAERNHHVVLALDTGHLMCEPIDGHTRLDLSINAALSLAYVTLKSGDRVGLFGFDARPRLHCETLSGSQAFPYVLRLTADLDYHAEETNYTLGLTDLAGRLERRALIVLFTEFVDTTTAELMLENVRRLVRRHLVLFVTMADPSASRHLDAPPDSLDDITRAVIADDLQQERRVVMERLRRLGVHVIDAKPTEIGPDLINRYLDIKRQDLI